LYNFRSFLPLSFKIVLSLQKEKHLAGCIKKNTLQGVLIFTIVYYLIPRSANFLDLARIAPTVLANNPEF